METKYKLVFLRHGQSTWNLENRFTGWTDVDLTDQGRAEAHSAGQLLRQGGYTFDVAYTSVLKRAVKTLWIVLEEMDLEWLTVINAWQLNERHYGALQGLNKAETAAKYSEAQVKLWRRSYDIPPPPLDMEDTRHPRFDRRYAALEPGELPQCESLKLERYLDARAAVLARHLGPGGAIRAARPGRGARQQYAGDSQVFG